MKVNTTKRTLILVILFLLALVGCTKPSKETILGKWHKVDGKPNETIEFLKDGSMLIGKSSAAVKYEIIDDSHFKIETNGILRSTVVSEYRFTGNKLVIKANDTGEDAFERVP